MKNTARRAMGGLVLLVSAALALTAGSALRSTSDRSGPARGAWVKLYASHLTASPLEVRWRVTSNSRGLLGSGHGEVSEPLSEQIPLVPGEVVTVRLSAGAPQRGDEVDVVVCSVTTSLAMVTEDRHVKSLNTPPPDVSCPATVIGT